MLFRLRPRKLLLILSFFLLSQSITSQEITQVKHPEWSKNASIYEVNVRQFSKEGNFKAVENYLPKFKELGIKILWLMPINPIGELNRKGTLGSYYSVKDYLKVNPEFGTMDDFKTLVKKTHENGMYLIIDWVANHTSWDNVLTKTNPEFFVKDSAGNFTPPAADWSDVIDLNYDNPELRKYMIDALKYWINEADIDGYRCDVASMVPMDFWNTARKELDKIKPVFMLAEAEGAQYHEAFDMTYTWNLHKLMNEIAQGDKNSLDLKNYFLKDSQGYPPDAYRMLFITNHDENSWKGSEFERMKEGVRTFAALLFTASGMPLMYTAQEIGIERRISFFEKDPVEWKENNFRKFYTTLVKLKTEHKALWNGSDGGRMEIVSDDKNVFSFIRRKDTDKVFVVMNLSDSTANCSLENNLLIDNYTELFSGKQTRLSNKASFTLKPWEYKVFVK